MRSLEEDGESGGLKRSRVGWESTEFYYASNERVLSHVLENCFYLTSRARYRTSPRTGLMVLFTTRSKARVWKPVRRDGNKVY